MMLTEILDSPQAKLEQAIMRPIIQSELQQKLDDSLMSTMSIEIEDKEEESKLPFLIFISQHSNRFSFSFKVFPSVRWK